MGQVAAEAWAEYQQQQEAEASQARENLRRRLTLRDNAPPLTRREARGLARTIVKEVGEIVGKHRAHNVAFAPFVDLSDDDEKARKRHDTRQNLAELCDGHGVEFPASAYGHAPEVARLSDVGWWGKKIRVKDWREWETRQIRLGRVRHFVSDEIAQVRTWHRAQMRQMLEGIFAVRDDGGVMLSLAELAEKSVSNPVIRRAEMITRAKGLATWRNGQGFTWTFITLTAPSKFHRMTTRDGRLVSNPKWQGATPRDTQAYLCAVWARIRAQLHRLRVDWSALRTVEPHSDGTPHWHLCLWCAPGDLDRIKKTVRHYALEMDGHEPGAATHRARFEDWRPADGDMVDRCIAYLIAYVSKNLDGREGVNATDSRDGHTADLGDSVESAARVEAWATTWGIRQFQELGGGPVTAWRELRRLREPVADPLIEPIRQAVDAGRYGEFVPMARAVGLRLWSETTADRLKVAAAKSGIAYAPSPELADLALSRDLFNRWGEPVRRWIKGIKTTAAGLAGTVITKVHTWAVLSSSEIEARAFDAASAAYWQQVGTLAARYSQEAHARAVAVAPGFFFSRAAPPRALDPCQ